MKKALAAMVVAVLLAIPASSALAGGGGWAVRVKGGGRALVTWGTWSGTSTVHVDLPWRHSVRVSGFAVVTIAGQRESGGPGKIVCTVLHGGVVVARTVGSGPYATCQTSAGRARRRGMGRVVRPRASGGPSRVPRQELRPSFQCIEQLGDGKRRVCLA